MKVILLSDVASVGRKGEVKNVSDGYAQNHLIPRGLARQATDVVLSAYEKQISDTKETKEKETNVLKNSIKKLAGERVDTKEKASETGHLFAGLHSKEISKLIKEKFDIEIPANIIEVGEPIKEAGEHKIKISAEGAESEITLAIEAI